MQAPFGKRNRPVVIKPARAKFHPRARPPAAHGKSRFYIYVAASILVLVLAGYALAY